MVGNLMDIYTNSYALAGKSALAHYYRLWSSYITLLLWGATGKWQIVTLVVLPPHSMQFVANLLYMVQRQVFLLE